MSEGAQQVGGPRGELAGDPSALMAEAEAHIRAGRLAAAEEAYSDIIASWPDAVEPRRQLGILYARSGRLKEAVELFEAAHRLAPDDPLYLNDLGHAYRAARRADLAAEAYRRAAALRPERGEGHFNLANLLRAQRRFEEAADAYKRAIAAEPGRVDFHINLGLTLQRLGLYEEGVAALRRAVALDGRSFEAHYNLAFLLAGRRRLEEAIDSYRAALALRPDAAAHVNLGVALEEEGRLEEAIESFARATELAPELTQAHVNLGAALYGKGDLEPALRAIRRALELEPRRALTYVNLAQTLEAMGDSEGAEAAFRSALTLDPTLTAAKAQWSIALRQMGRWEEALALLDYPHLLVTRRLDAMPPWPSVAAFNAELTRYIYNHPTLIPDPPGLATKNGRRSLEVLNCTDRPVAALQRFLDEAVADYVARALRPSANPHAPPAIPAWRLNGWAVVLRSSGYQAPHFHAPATISGVYYVQIPAIVGTKEAGEAGYIKFGPPHPGTAERAAEDTPLTRGVRPENGLLVLFPGYFWHYTVPFESREDRICVAFDVIADAGPARGNIPA